MKVDSLPSHAYVTVGPIIASQAARTAELDISLLERLFNRPLYAEHPFARSKMHAGMRKVLDIRPFTNLVKVHLLSPFGSPSR
jgi:hypothetical protein